MVQSLKVQEQMEHIAESLETITEPGELFEVRILGALKNQKAICSGYFDDRHKAAAAIMQYDHTAKGIYVTINPVHKALHARAANRIVEYAKETTQDQNITRRTRLLIDCDPVRPSGISSSQEEYNAAHDRAMDIWGWLASQDWPFPLSANSGNGAHLMYAIDLPNDQESRSLIESCLKALDQRFSDDEVKVDTGVANASRISKVYGTVSRKGDPTPDRPHRRSGYIIAPEQIEPVSRAQLEALAALHQTSPSLRQRQQSIVSCSHTSGGASYREKRWREAWAARMFEKAAELVRSPGAYGKAGHHHGRLAAGKLLGGLIAHNLASASEIENFLMHAKPPDSDEEKERKAIQDGIREGEHTPLDVPPLPEKPEPSYDADGHACCPVCGKRLRQSKNGNGWRCLSPSGDLCYWWPGETYTSPSPIQSTRANQQQPEQKYVPSQGERDTRWRDPLPLHQHKVQEFPEDALPDWLRAYTTGVAAALEMDSGAMSLMALSVLALIYQGRYRVGITTGVAPWEEPLSLWTLFTAEPGERKSAVLKNLTRPLLQYQQRYDRVMQSRYEAALIEYNARQDADEDAEIDEAATSAHPPQEPPPLALTLTDTTQEALVQTMRDQQERAGIFSAEGNSLFAVHLGGAYRSTNAADVSLLNAAWSGDAVDVSRKRDRQRCTLYAPSVSMGVCVQPGVLSGASANRIARASGFLARWLYCCPNSALGQRTHDPPESNPAHRVAYDERMLQLLEEAYPMLFPPPPPSVRTISLNPAAYQSLRDYQRLVEPRLKNTNALAVYRDWYAKAPGQAVRIAALLSLICGESGISAEQMKNGIAIVEWSAAHMQRAYNISSGEDVHLATRAVALIQRRGWERVTASAIRRGLSVSSEEAEEVVRTLIDYGYIKESENKRRTVEYAVHPCVHEQKGAEQEGNGAELGDTASQSVIAPEDADGCRSGCRAGIMHSGAENGQSAEREVNVSHPPLPTSCSSPAAAESLHGISAPWPNNATGSGMPALHPSLQGAPPESDESASECPETGSLHARAEHQLPSAGHHPDETIFVCADIFNDEVPNEEVLKNAGYRILQIDSWCIYCRNETVAKVDSALPNARSEAYRLAWEHYRITQQQNMVKGSVREQPIVDHNDRSSCGTPQQTLQEEGSMKQSRSGGSI